MKKFFTSSLLNLGLRGFSMLAKFLLVVYIGKYLSVDDLGEYGLFVTTVTIAIYFLGLDFYTYNTREILAKDKEKRLPLIRDQFIFHLVVYALVLPLLLLVFTFEIIPIEFIVYFYLILVFEHLGQELYRLFITLKQPLFANFLLFLRTGLWAYVIITIWYIGIENMQNLKTVWIAWIVGSFLSILVGLLYLNKNYDFRSITEKIDWVWIKNGFYVSMPFFIGTLAYKVIEFSDRYMIDYYMTKADVGIYTFFGSIANTINIIVFTTVIMVYYPLLVEQYEHQKEVFKKTLKIFTIKTIIISLFSAIAIVMLIYPVLDYMGKDEFYGSIDVLWLLIIANIVLNVSFIPHYVLYVAKKDIVIRNATLIGAFLNIILNIILIPIYGINGAALATMCSFLIIGLVKFQFSRYAYE